MQWRERRADRGWCKIKRATARSCRWPGQRYERGLNESMCDTGFAVGMCVVNIVGRREGCVTAALRADLRAGMASPRTLKPSCAFTRRTRRTWRRSCHGRSEAEPRGPRRRLIARRARLLRLFIVVHTGRRAKPLDVHERHVAVDPAAHVRGRAHVECAGQAARVRAPGRRGGRHEG